MSKASNTWLKPLGKENDGNTSPSSYDNTHGNERAKARSYHHDRTRDNQERYNKSPYSSVHFDYTHVTNNEHKSWHHKTCSFVDYITMYLLSLRKEWQHKRGSGMKGLLHNRKRRRKIRSRERILIAVIATEVAIKEPRFGGSIQSNTLRTKHQCKNHFKQLFDKKKRRRKMTPSL